MTDLDKLIAAVEAGNPEWDADFMDGLVDWDMNPRPALLVLHAWNGSLDAALRLHDALLPGWGWVLDEAVDGRDAHVYAPTGAYKSSGTADHIARAWLLAILRALAALPAPPEGEKGVG